MKDPQTSGLALGSARFADRGLTAMAVLSASIAWAVWDVYAFSRDQGSLAVELNIAMGWFVVLAFAYLGFHGLRNMAWTSVPVLLTLRAIAEYVLSPAWQFLTAAVQVDAIYVHAIVLVLVGFACLWLASSITLRSNRIQFAAHAQTTSFRVALICVLMFSVGVATALVEWRLGLLGLIPQLDPRHLVNPYAGLLGFLYNLLLAALVVSAIEKFGKRSTRLAVHAVFWLALVALVAAGIVSAMKGAILMPFLIVLLVHGVIRRRVPRLLLLLPLTLPVIYPFNTAYRNLLQSGYSTHINTLSGLEAALGDAARSTEGVLTGTAISDRSVLERATGRLSVLGYVHDIIGLPAPSLLNGQEKVWMAPFYPFIPRLLWKSKPVLNKGVRLSLALGYPATTSTALTPIGDLYTLYGTPGVAIGMFIYGLALQLFMNVMGRGEITERGLFFFLSVLMPMINMEIDVVSLVSGTIQTILLMLVIARVIYGPQIPFWRRNTRQA